MNYHPRSRNRFRQLILVAVFFIVAGVTFRFLAEPILALVTPLWRAENLVTRELRSLYDFFSFQKNLTRENAFLRERVESLEIELASLELSLERDKRLEELLGRSISTDGVVASVLTYPPQTPYDIVVVDAGEIQGVLPGSKVFLPEGPLLGEVFEVLNNNSKVKLYSSSGESVSGVLESSNTPVTLEGQGGGNFKIILPREVEVSVGERVLSASVGSELLAVVGDVKLLPTDSFKEVLASSPINIFNLRFVFVR